MAEQMRRGPGDSHSAAIFGFQTGRVSGQLFGAERASVGAGEGFWGRSRTKRLSPLEIGIGLCLADFVTSLVAGSLGFLVLTDATSGLDAFSCALFVATPIFTVCTFYERGFYSRKAVLRPLEGLGQVALGWLCVCGLLLLAAVAWSAIAMQGSQAGASSIRAGLNGPWPLAVVAAGLSGCVATRVLWSAVRKHLVGRVLVHGRAVVVGTGPEAEQVINRLRDDRASGLEVVGVLDGCVHQGRASLCGVAVLGGVEDMAGAVRRSEADTVIVALPWVAGTRIAAALAAAGRLPVTTRLAPDAMVQAYLRHPVSSVAEQPLLDVHDLPIAGSKAVVKRAEDLVLAAALLLAAAPMLLVIAVAIKLDSRGPLIFKQPRRGLYNRVFNLYKFRSMHTHAADTACVRQTSRDDPRLTRVGAFLRRHSLDELPQLLNVLRGEMSIVGPRPHALSTRAEGLLLEDVLDSYVDRYRVKPGITGWAQVNGWRGELDTREKLERRVEFDLDYAERWSVPMDLRILCLTLRCVLRDGHAY